MSVHSTAEVSFNCTGAFRMPKRVVAEWILWSSSKVTFTRDSEIVKSYATMGCFKFMANLMYSCFSWMYATHVAQLWCESLDTTFLHMVPAGFLGNQKEEEGNNKAAKCTSLPSFKCIELDCCDEKPKHELSTHSLALQEVQAPESNGTCTTKIRSLVDSSGKVGIQRYFYQNYNARGAAPIVTGIKQHGHL